MEALVKIIVAGLDNAGKTSILTALDKKYDFHKEVISLTPTIRVEYHATEFLGQRVIFWDCGGQQKYRELYQSKPNFYFDGTDLLLYVIDVQDKERYKISLEYLEMILGYFIVNNIDVPVIVTFHKYDPEIRAHDTYLEEIKILREKILEKYPNLKILFQQTSIFDIISIIQLVSYGLSVFDEKFFDLSDLLENYLKVFNSKSLILFDRNGIIISEFYSHEIRPEYYIELLESIKEHLFLLKRMQEESYEAEYNLSTDNTGLLSYLHRLVVGRESLFISVILEDSQKDNFLEKFDEFLTKLNEILTPILS
ncbi:MAG: ADP-ribosylation factor-like protein [Candidatus Thorarchaeota archaeon]